MNWRTIQLVKLQLESISKQVLLCNPFHNIMCPANDVRRIISCFVASTQVHEGVVCRTFNLLLIVGIAPPPIPIITTFVHEGANVE